MRECTRCQHYGHSFEEWESSPCARCVAESEDAARSGRERRAGAGLSVLKVQDTGDGLEGSLMRQVVSAYCRIHEVNSDAARYILTKIEHPDYSFRRIGAIFGTGATTVRRRIAEAIELEPILAATLRVDHSRTKRNALHDAARRGRNKKSPADD